MHKNSFDIVSYLIPFQVLIPHLRSQCATAATAATSIPHAAAAPTNAAAVAAPMPGVAAIQVRPHIFMY
jgi:biotin carboxyl carrier protein